MEKAVSLGMPDNMIAYAIGDVHGCPWLLTTVMSWIESHAEAFPEARKLIVVLGDVIDRGPDSRGVIDLLLADIPVGFEMICLRGNHEDMMLRVLDTGGGLSLWMQNGGIPTLNSYGLDNTDYLLQFSPAATRHAISAAVPPAHQRFLRDTTLSHQAGDYLFVHAGIRPGISLDRQEPEDLLWIREEFTHSAADLGGMVIHGHTVFREPSIRSNAIGIDTGAVKTGRLSCVALWQDQRLFFTTSKIQP